MSPDAIFWLSLIVKMIVTAGFVLAATIAAERAGPLIGGLIATLPIAAGPVYVFLAFDHDAQFISQAALTSLAVNPVIAIYALTFALLAQRRGRAVSVLLAFWLWLALAMVVNAVDWSFFGALLFNLAVLPVCLAAAKPLRNVTMPRVKGHWSDIVLRAISVAILVAVVVALSFQIGPGGTGILAVFPIVLTSIMFIMHRRVGGPAAAAVLASTVLGLVGLALAIVMLHLTAVPLGAPLALSLALAVSVGWSLAMWTAKKRGLPV